MTIKDLSSIILSIFLRKGGEGIFTRIIKENSKEIDKLYHKDNESEKSLIVSYNDAGFTIFTNQRIVNSFNGSFDLICYSSLENVRPAVFNEFKSLVTEKINFTTLKITEKNGTEFLLVLEKGMPFMGIYQFLSFLSRSKK